MRLVLLAAATACGVSGCGPSYQVLYEGDVHFERCYALEEKPDQTLEAKSTCWHTYIANHVYGQTRDRIRYAGIRERALSRAPELPTDEAMMQAAPGESVTPSVNSPAPRSAFAPPPSTMADTAVDNVTTILPASPTFVTAPTTPAAAPTSSASSPTEPPRTLCAVGCGDAWRSCKVTCAGQPSRECGPCDRTYKACMKACFQ